MPEPRGELALAYREQAGHRKRVRFTPVERADGDVWSRTTEEWTGCAWRITGREYVDNVSLEADAAATTSRAGP